MNELAAALKIALSNTYLMYFKAHTYHWNVEGMFFSQFHEFFGDIYEEVYGAVDPMAEQMRALDVYAPVSFAEMIRSASIVEDAVKPSDVKSMLANLQTANQQALDSLNKAFDLAAGNDGLQNFLADRIDQHNKHAWMLRASLKG